MAVTLSGASRGITKNYRKGTLASRNMKLPKLLGVELTMVFRLGHEGLCKSIALSDGRQYSGGFDLD